MTSVLGFMLFSLANNNNQDVYNERSPLRAQRRGPRSDALLGRSEGKASETSHTSGTIRRNSLTMKDFDPAGSHSFLAAIRARRDLPPIPLMRRSRRDAPDRTSHTSEMYIPVRTSAT